MLKLIKTHLVIIFTISVILATVTFHNITVKGLLIMVMTIQIFQVLTKFYHSTKTEEEIKNMPNVVDTYSKITNSTKYQEYSKELEKQYKTVTESLNK